MRFAHRLEDDEGVAIVDIELVEVAGWEQAVDGQLLQAGIADPGLGAEGFGADRHEGMERRRGGSVSVFIRNPFGAKRNRGSGSEERLQDDHVGSAIEKEMKRLGIDDGPHGDGDETRLQSPGAGEHGRDVDTIANELRQEGTVVVELDEMAAVINQVVGTQENVLAENATHLRIEGLELEQRLDENAQRAG